MNNIFQTLFAVIFPPLCLGCKKYCATEEEKRLFLCNQCDNAIEMHNSFFCPECNRRLPEAKNTCHPESKFILAAASSYQNKIVREIIHSLKYNRMTAAMKPIGKIIENYLNKIIPNMDVRRPYIIVPIPLHAQKLRARGFNQSELIAQELAIKLRVYDTLNLEIETNNLIRIKNTKSQTKLKKEERRANIEHCFTLKNPAEISGKNIILVDDVFTSGATMREAVKILKAAGAKKIVGFVVAKT